MTTIAPIQFTVVNGPNAADVLNSLLYAFSPQRLSVHFECEGIFPQFGFDRTSFDAIITGVEYESGMSGMFLIEFHVVSHGGWTNCHGFYDANRRRGTLQMTAVG